MRRTNDSDDFTGQRLPGTGGDFLDTSDVEGHIRRDAEGVLRRDGEGIRRDAEGIRRDGDLDVEGHIRRDGGDTLRREGGPDELYRGGPTTQGEVLRRGPGDNPHAD